MGFGDLLRGAINIGLLNIARSVQYSRQKDRLQRTYLLPQVGPHNSLPGVLLSAEPSSSGGVFRFQDASLEIRFLTEDMLLVDWAPEEPAMGFPLTESDWEAPAAHLSERSPSWALKTAHLTVVVRPDGSLAFEDPDGAQLHEDMPPKFGGEGWTLSSPLRTEEHLYGLGERAAPLNLRPGTYRMWNRDPAGAYGPGSDPLYITIPVMLGQHSLGSYLLFFENSFDGTFRFEQEAQITFNGGPLRYYFIAGTPSHCLERFSQLTGRPPMPPRWALGYHQSRWGYKSAQEIRDVANGFREHDLPLSAIHLDLDYMRGHRVFTVDERRFPDMKPLSDELAADNTRLVAIIDPGVKVDRNYTVFQEGEQGKHFCTYPTGETLQAPVWPGWCAFPDFTNPRTRAWWGTLYASLLEQGIEGFWHDMNEPSAFALYGDLSLPLPTKHDMDGKGGDHRQAHNLYGLFMNKAGFEGLKALRPGKRPFILSRSGWAGVQRHAWTWTADILSSWEGLQQTVPTALGLSLSGVPYTGPDIGGFVGKPSPELYLRWFQLAAFLPFFRTHSAVWTIRQEPWCFGEQVLDIARQFLRLRYQLLPYLYTLAWQASKFGLPLIRPLFWDDDNPELWGIQDSFLLGDSLLVAPVLQPQSRLREVKLPRGSWYGLWDGSLHQGNQTLQQPISLEQIPVFVRGGSLLPMAEEGTLILHLYPPAQGHFEALVYDDAGDGYGAWRLDRFNVQRSGDQIEIDWQQEGDFAFPYKQVEIVLHGRSARGAWVDQTEVRLENNKLRRDSPFAHLRLEY